MLKKYMLAAAAAVALGSLGYGTAGAAAAMISPGSPPPALENPQASGIQQVASKRQIRRWRYMQRRHGNRYRSRHGNYRHYHDGYWYSSPWWARDNDPGFSLSIGIPGVALGVGNRGGSHVQWCYDRYRSYDASSNTFMGYDGMRHRCNSPYD